LWSAEPAATTIRGAVRASFELPRHPLAEARGARAAVHTAADWAAERLNPLTLAAGAVTATVALLAAIGADARWVAAMGRALLEGRAVPDFVPYASAPSEGWANVPALAELVFHALVTTLGDRGLTLAHIVVVAAGFAVLTADMRRGGATRAGAALVVLALAVGAVQALVAVRLQTPSLLLFPLLVALLRAETRSPSNRIWLVPMLLAVWSNLHGAALVGLAVTGAYLLFERLRRDPVRAVPIGLAAPLAICLTPALERTPEYYLGVMQNEAARRGAGMWASLSPTSPLDVVFVVVAVAFLALAVRARPARWELVAMAGLALMTVQTARSGVWLLLLAAVPAARALRVADSRVRLRVSVPMAVALVAVTAFAVARGPAGADTARAVAEAVRQAQGTPILAGPALAEQVALEGGRVWVANPIDAFRPADQRLYLDWLEGRPAGDAALGHAPRAVLVRDGEAADDRLAANPAFTASFRSGGAVLYVRRDRR
jgi:hypothetical protein